jgi:hypothetical protein
MSSLNDALNGVVGFCFCGDTVSLWRVQRTYSTYFPLCHVTSIDSSPPVSWIRILVRIRVRASDQSGSYYFRSWPSRRQIKTIFSLSVSALYFFWRYIYSIFLRQKPQNSRDQGFSYYFSLMIELSGSGAGSGSVPLAYGSGGQKHTDPTDPDPDPQHCSPLSIFKVCQLNNQSAILYFR